MKSLLVAVVAFVDLASGACQANNCIRAVRATRLGSETLSARASDCARSFGSTILGPLA